LFDDETLALMEVDDLTARLLMKGAIPPLEGDVPENVREALTGIEALREKGVICLDRDMPVAGNSEPELTFVLLNVSHACDMKCAYCFGQGGSYGGPAILMDEDVARRAIDLLAASPVNAAKRIAIFGGEPLTNPKLVEFILTYGRETIGDKDKLGFSISTNGTMLTPEITRLLMEHSVSTQISIDGTRELQNRLRPLRSGLDSYAAVSASIAKCVKVNPNLHARATVTNLCSDATDLAAQLFSMGFRSISLQPVHGCGELNLNDTQIEELGEGYRTLARRGLGHQVSWIDSCMRRIRGRARTEIFCGAGWHGLTVTPEGAFYLCHRLIPIPEFRIGDVWSGVNQDRLRDLLCGKQSVENSLVCSSCMYRHLCGGGCMAENYFESGQLTEPWSSRCSLTKSVCTAAIDAYIEEIYRIKDDQLAPESVTKVGEDSREVAATSQKNK